MVLFLNNETMKFKTVTRSQGKKKIRIWNFLHRQMRNYQISYSEKFLAIGRIFDLSFNLNFTAPMQQNI